MPRPCKRRRVCALPERPNFGPVGAGPVRQSVPMTVDEFETIRLIDLEGLTQEACAGQMEVSRATVQAIYGSARHKLAQALVQAVSVWGSTVVFVLAFLLMALGAFRLTILDVADWIFNRPQYEPQEIPERPSRTRTAPSRAAVPEHTT